MIAHVGIAGLVPAAVAFAIILVGHQLFVRTRRSRLGSRPEPLLLRYDSEFAEPAVRRAGLSREMLLAALRERGISSPA